MAALTLTTPAILADGVNATEAKTLTFSLAPELFEGDIITFTDVDGTQVQRELSPTDIGNGIITVDLSTLHGSVSYTTTLDFDEAVEPVGMFDTTAPTVTSILLADASLKVGETSLVTITFSEAVTNFTNADLTIENGTLSDLVSADGGLTWTATFTPTVAIEDITNVITVEATYTDLAGNTGDGGSSGTFAIDTLAPTAPSAPDLASGNDSGSSSSDNLTTVTTPTFTGTAEAGATVTLYDTDGTTVLGTSIATGGIWSITASALAAGSHTLTAKATDAAGNVSSSSGPLDITIDTTAPTLAITSDVSSLKFGQTATITFTFSEDPGVSFVTTDIAVSGGTVSAISGSGLTRTATFTPDEDTNGGTASITVASGTYLDAAGNNGGAGATPSLTFDTQAPTATIVVADTALKAGETSLVTITFSEAVTGFSNADLTISNGTLSAVASSDGGVTWTATFTPTSSVEDATNFITLNNTGVVDAAGNAGSGTSDSNNYAIDTKAPTATIVVADTALKVGETSLVTITFSEAVTGFSNADLTISNGTLSAVASSDGGVTWTATFTPTSSVEDATNLITLNNTGVADAAGNAGSGTGDSNNYAVDTKAPTLSITSDVPSLTVGEVATITFTFSEDPGASFTWDGSAGDIVVTGGTLGAISGSGLTRTATFTPDAATDGGAASITVASSTYTDAAGNSGSAGVTPSLTFDTQAPTAGTLSLTSLTDTGASNLDGLTGDRTFDLTLTGVEGGTVVYEVNKDEAGWVLTTAEQIDLIDGSYQFRAVVTDLAGNSATSNVTMVQIDGIASAAPGVSLTTDTGAADTITSNGALSLTGVEADADVEYSIDNGETWSASFAALEGENSVQVRQTDVAGNVSASTAFSFTLDTQAATGLAFSGISSDTGISGTDEITRSKAFDISGTAEAGSLVEVSLDGDVLGTALADGDGQWTYGVTGLADGSYEFTATATDIAGNTSLPASLAVVVDNTSPAPVVTGISDDRGSSATDNLTSDNNLAISGTAEAGSSVEVILTGPNGVEITLVGIANETGLWSVQSGLLADGAYTATAVSTDLAGNVRATTSPFAFTVDTTAPTVDVVLGVQDESGASTVTFTFNEAVDGFAEGDLQVVGGVVTGLTQDLLADPSGKTFTATFTEDPDFDGNASVTVVGGSYTDLAANSGAEETSNTIVLEDTNAPTVASVVLADASLTVGQTTLVTITFSEAVTGFDLSDLTAENRRAQRPRHSRRGDVDGDVHASRGHRGCHERGHCRDLLHGRRRQCRRGRHEPQLHGRHQGADGSDALKVHHQRERGDRNGDRHAQRHGRRR